MRTGLRVWDADTHVNPAADVLDRLLWGNAARFYREA